MKRTPSLVALSALVSLAACAGMPSPATPSAAAEEEISRAYSAALEAEALDPMSAAPYLDLIDRAVAHPEAPGALDAELAAVDALVMGSLPGFDAIGTQAIAHRSRDLWSMTATRLQAAWAAAGEARASSSEPARAAAAFMRGNLASALHELALFTGDVGAARGWAARRGCAMAATLVGPLDWTPLRGLEDASPIAATAPLAKGYAGIAPFAADIAPRLVRGDACMLDVNATTSLQGVRAVVVDLAVPRAQAIHVALLSSSAAVVDVGGVRAIRRGFEAGGKPVMRLASVAIPAAGSVRVVARIAQKGDGALIELDAWGDDGEPLRVSAPAVGVAANVTASSATPVELAAFASQGSSTASPARKTLAAAGLIALGETRAAEHLLEPVHDGGATNDASTRPPGLELIYGRALEFADDMPDNKLAERVRGANERTLAGWPGSWEAKIDHARVIERRRGAGEGTTEALRALGATPARGDDAKAEALDPMIAAYVAVSAKHAQILDVAEHAYNELAKKSPGSPLLAAVDSRLHGRVGGDAIAASCHGGLRRADLDCYEALRESGDLGAAIAELDRLRRLRGAPDAFAEEELATRIVAGDLKGALAVYDAMDPGERRMIEALGFAAGRSHDAREARARLARDRLTARDSPYSLAPLMRALGVEADPAPRLEEEGKRLVAADQRAAFLPGAGTAVLRHLERYEIDANGLVHFLQYDLRRVSGTTDVAQGATAFGPAIEGRSSTRLLRKRIHKRDGRVLEPDAAANASQASDLSQLEQGDYIEQIAEGWALPGDTGQIVIDTPDLLPERTSVREASIEIRRASKIPFAIWAHPLLGAPEEKVDGDFKVSTWRLKDRPPRRIEDGVPKMERSVSVSVGTQTWSQIARALEENVRSLDERDPYVMRWLEEALGSAAIAKASANAPETVERVVAAVGKRVKVASGGELSDVAAIYGGGSQRTTARTILELGQGSRAWVVYRALRALGIDASLAIAETEPWTSIASFPPHVGRFRHPIVVAHVGRDMWIDADVEGPPLPPGRVSPELRGRTAMLDNGTMVPVEGVSGETGDEVDVRLALDEKGDARGSFTVLLRGRTAQSLAELFETVVGTDRREMLRNVVLGWLPWADVDEVAVSSSEGSWEVALRASIAIQGFGRPEGKDGKTWVLTGLEPVHVVFPRSGVGMLGATYASRGARQNALSIESPLQYHVRRRIDLPPGATIARRPANVDVTDPNVTARRVLTHKGATLEEDFTLSLPTGTVPAGRYKAFVEKVQAIDDGFMAGTRIRVKP